MRLNLYVAATGMNVGKTSFILGLIHNLRKRGIDVGYLKPVSHRHIDVDGETISEDAHLIRRTFDLPFPPETMGPCIIKRGLTARYIQGNMKSFMPKIIKAYRRIEEKSDLVIIEGAGHAGVGSVIDLSNGDVARMLGAPVLILGTGGIGSTIDSVMLNKSLFDLKKCPVIGFVVNKVQREKYDKVSSLLSKESLKRNIPVFGFLPYEAALSSLTLSSVKEELRARVINPRGKFDARIDNNVIATMEPAQLINIVSKTDRNVLVVTSADRSDIILACATLHYGGEKNLTGILLSGSTLSAPIKEVLGKIPLPVIACDESIYTISSILHGMTVKISPRDDEKKETLFEYVSEFIDVDRLLVSISSQETELGQTDRILLFFRRMWESIKAFFPYRSAE